MAKEEEKERKKEGRTKGPGYVKAGGAAPRDVKYVS